MQTRLIAIGNSYGVRLPKSIIRQFDFDKGELEITIKEDGILISPVADVPLLADWDKLFKDAKKKGFDAKKEADDFGDWDIILSDGNDQL